jgi:hypothetical protein
MPKAPAKRKAAPRRKMTKNDPDHPMYRFKALKGGPVFNVSNEKWATDNLPVLRIASVSLMKDWRQHLKIVEGLHGPKGWDPLVKETFEHFDRVRDNLNRMIKLIDAAEARWIVSCSYFEGPGKDWNWRKKPRAAR